MTILGQVLGERYRVEELIGVGRFASVFVATDVLSGEARALKLFKPSVANMSIVGKRFFRRTDKARRSPHPVILPILDCGQTADEVPFLIMELLRGRSVGQEVEEKGALAIQRCLDVMTHLLEGLAAVHAEGLVHRDINASNILLLDPGQPEPSVRITDMGVAGDLVDILAITPSETGSTSYLAPEHLLDVDRAWTAAVDVFAAGMVSFLMLAGRLPISRTTSPSVGDNTICRYRGLTSLPGPSRFRQGVPEPLERVVDKALSIDRSKRYRNAGEMLEDLEDAKTGIDLTALEDVVEPEGEGPWHHAPFLACPPSEKTDPWGRMPAARAGSNRWPSPPALVRPDREMDAQDLQDDTTQDERTVELEATVTEDSTIVRGVTFKTQQLEPLDDLEAATAAGDGTAARDGIMKTEVLAPLTDVEDEAERAPSVLSECDSEGDVIEDETTIEEPDWSGEDDTTEERQ